MRDIKHEWAGHAQWRVLETNWLDGAGVLQRWHDWRADPQRPGLLHLVCVLPCPTPRQDLARLAPLHLQPLAGELSAAWWGLVPGLHRISLDGGRVLLTLFIGPLADALREIDFAADAIALNGPDADTRHDLPLLKALSRRSRPGTLLSVSAASDAMRQDLRTCGFLIETEGPGGLQARFAPAWKTRIARLPPAAPREALVIGAGLAGAAAAASLARRGWQVRVLDAAAEPASGASGLPAGLMAPHLTPDDNLLSRLARAGLRITRAQAQALLREGTDWQGGGTLEHRVKVNAKARPLDTEGFAADWSHPASRQQRDAACLSGDTPAVWHPAGAWIRPGALVRAWLQAPGIAWQGNTLVARLERRGGDWHALAEDGRSIASAPLAVIAAALGSGALCGGRLWLHPVRGQVSWGPRDGVQDLPPFPVNGNGHLLPDVPLDGQRVWMSGSSYGRGETDRAERPADHLANLERLEVLLPRTAERLAVAFATGRVRGWAGVRCASTDRRPLVGPLDEGLWVSTAMGSRGLTFAALCGELLAARLHGEPLPLPASLAPALDIARQRRD